MLCHWQWWSGCPRTCILQVSKHPPVFVHALVGVVFTNAIVRVDKIIFPGQTVNFGLQHVIHIVKAIVPAVNFSYVLKALFEHPTRRQIFANTVG